LNIKWYRRKNNKEDPWISLHDHEEAIKKGTMVYGANKSGGKKQGNGRRKGGNRFNSRPQFPDYSGGSDNVIPLNGLYNKPI